MANVIILAGASGTGKTRSIKNLDPKETYIINILNKPLSFKGSNTKYTVESKNIKSINSFGDVLTVMKSINEKALHVKNLILDDVGFLMTTEFFDRVKETGYSKFGEIGHHMQQVISYATTMRTDLNVVFMFHEEDEEDDGIKVSKKLKLIGKMLDDKYNPLATVSIVLFTNVSTDKENKTTYNFITNRTFKGKQLIPAKSPEEMFEELTIPNDLEYVFKKVKEYYN